ncbi:MAG: DUF5317 family protein [Armatimonadetes bacterium]|nr:DUF5317 family protein [Armatimonadota bacterium]
MLLLSVLLLSLLVGLARGGSVLALGQQRWRFPLLPIIALGLQVVGFWPDESASQGARTLAGAFHVASYGIAFAFVWANRQTPWLWLLGLGLAANAVVIAANQGFMPVPPDGLGGTASSEVARHGYYNNAVLLKEDTRLWFLGDVLRTPRWLLGRAFSVGDGTIAVAVFIMVQHLMRPPGLHWPRRAA